MPFQSLTYTFATIAENAIKTGTQLFEQSLGLDVYHVRILRLIDDQPGITFTPLAGQTRLDRSATSRSLQRLIKAGLVERFNDTVDARQFHLVATAKGRALRRKSDPLTLEMERLMLQTLDAKEREAFLDCLNKIADWVNDGYKDAVKQRFPETSAPAKAARAGKGAARAPKLP
ncbi:MAG: MarR family winged helix-turn-helix transcriptional regulator [Hyphomicrobiales bacterium]|nr:MarR family winged helix-turn-helix transcriptional regulator [Hyphomicrobiales bacterium]MDE2115874.1 winged helix-turn-helix transcriptional regulator [Hyphomicrobiales bacterium]